MKACQSSFPLSVPADSIRIAHTFQPLPNTPLNSSDEWFVYAIVAQDGPVLTVGHTCNCWRRASEHFRIYKWTRPDNQHRPLYKELARRHALGEAVTFRVVSRHATRDLAEAAERLFTEVLHAMGEAQFSEREGFRVVGDKDQRAKYRNRSPGRLPPQAVIATDLSTGAEQWYPSQKAAAVGIGARSGNVSRCVRGRLRTTAGHTFRAAEAGAEFLAS